MILSGEDFDHGPFSPNFFHFDRDETLSFLQQFGRSGAGRSVSSGVRKLSLKFKLIVETMLCVQVDVLFSS